MDPVERQYEAYPYPHRDPADEARRLIVGSPSHPVEIDHFLFRGARDWTKPFRVLVAGGGTGDALVMLAQLLAARGTPAEIHYLDLSKASRAVAEARIAARGLGSVRFHTADLLSAPELGRFDYIDCCGVLHHLPDPAAGFRALAEALSPEGGLGGMVYAPDGRRGVYELQAALAPLVDGLAPEAQVAVAREVLERLPASHAFKQNPLLGDHLRDDAGLYDLLLHARDRPYRADALIAELEAAGLRLAGFLEPARYDPALYLNSGQALERAKGLPAGEKAALAERLAGNIKVHVFYAAPAARNGTTARASDPQAVPIVHGADRMALAQQIAAHGRVRLTIDGIVIERTISKHCAAILQRCDGRRTLRRIGEEAGLDWFALSSAMTTLEGTFGGFNLLRCSRFQMP